jgi:NADPH-dependent F420 reductase
MENVKTIAVIGGTGNLGSALARRWAKAGLSVVIGSRAAESALKAATELGFGLTGMSNAEAAATSDLVVMTVPFSAQTPTLLDIAPYVTGKIVVDTTVPLMPPKVMQVQLPEEGSAAVRAKNLLGNGVNVVSAFHNVAAHKLITDEEIACDILVFGDDKTARSQVIGLAKAAGLRGLHGGALVNAAAAEALTSILIFLNRTYKVDGAGIQITGTLIEPAA